MEHTIGERSPVMARRRMIWTKISTSVQVNGISEFAQLLFTWMIAHADDYGVMKAHPKFVKAQVMPLSSRKFSEFQGALEEMEAAGLIHLYEADGEGPLLQFRRWEDHQSGLTRRTRTGKLPRFIDIHGVSVNYNEIHPEQNLTEQNLTEDNNQWPFSQIFTEVTGVLIAGRTQGEEIDAWMEDVPEEWFRAACKAAADRNARNWAYVRKILENCKSEGRAPGDAARKRTDGSRPDWWNEDYERTLESS